MTRRFSRTDIIIAGPTLDLDYKAPATDEISPADLADILLAEVLAGSGLTVADIDALVADLDHAEDEAHRAADTPDRHVLVEKGKRTRVKSQYRDERFRLVLQGVQPHSEVQSEADPTVTSTTPLLPLSRSTKRSEKARAKFIRELEQLPDYRRPAEWIAVADLTRITYWDRAVAEADGRPFTLRLDHETEARAKADKKSAIDYIRRRLARRLPAGTDYWFAIEKEPGIPLHVHGGVVVADTKEARTAMRKAMRLAGGEWDEARQHQAHLGFTASDEGWGSYSSKADHRVRAGGIIDRCGERPFKGKHLYATNKLKKEAESFYKIDRDLMISAIKTSKPKRRSKSSMTDPRRTSKI